MAVIAGTYVNLYAGTKIKLTESTAYGSCRSGGSHQKKLPPAGSASADLLREPACAVRFVYHQQLCIQNAGLIKPEAVSEP